MREPSLATLYPAGVEFSRAPRAIEEAVTDFRRPDLDLWEEEADDDDGRPTLVGPRPVGPTETSPAGAPPPAPSELVPTPAFGHAPSSAARDAQARLRDAEKRARQREARPVDPQRALLLQAKWAEARGLSAADTTLTDDVPPFHPHDDEDTRPIPPNFPALLADSELAEYESHGLPRPRSEDAIAKLRAGELPREDYASRPSLPAEELRSSEVDRLMVRPPDEWGAFVDGLTEHVASGPRAPLPSPTALTPSRPVPQHTLRGLGTPGVAEGIAEGLRPPATPLPAPAVIASSWPPVNPAPRVARELPISPPRNPETERVFGTRKPPMPAPHVEAPVELLARPQGDAFAVDAFGRPAPQSALQTPVQPRIPQLVSQSQPVPMPVPMPSIAPASDAPAWEHEPPAEKSGVTWWQLAAAAVVMVVVGKYVSAYGRQASWLSDTTAVAARDSDRDAIAALAQPRLATAEERVPEVSAEPTAVLARGVDEAVAPPALLPPKPQVVAAPTAPTVDLKAAAPKAAKTVAEAKPKRVWLPRPARKDVPVAPENPSGLDLVREYDEPRTASAASPAAANSDLPAQPARADIVAAMSAVMPALQNCVGANHGDVALKLTIRPTGVVSYALIDGDFAGTKEGSCLAQAVREAKFPAFSDPVLRLTYPVRL